MSPDRSRRCKRVRVGHLVVSLLVLAGPPADAQAGSAGADPWAFPTHQGRHHGFQPAADGSRERVLRFPDGPSWLTLRIAPATGGVTCFILHYPGDGSGLDGCPSDAVTRRMHRLGPHSILSGGESAFLFGTVGRGVVSVDVLYSSGKRRRTRPKEGFVVVENPDGSGPAMRAVVRGPGGRDLRRITFS